MYCSADNGVEEEEKKKKRDDREPYRNHLGIHDVMKQTVMRPDISNNPPDTLLRMTKLQTQKRGILQRIENNENGGKSLQSSVTARLDAVRKGTRFITMRLDFSQTVVVLGTGIRTRIRIFPASFDKEMSL